MKKISGGGKDRLIQALPGLIVALFVLQPLMDVLSYWLSTSGMGNTLSLALRFSVLAAVTAAGYLLSDRRRVYWAAAGILLAFALCHIAAVLQADAATAAGAGEATGWRPLLEDLANYVRVVQMPVFALCFITFLRKNENSYSAIQKGFFAALLVIAAVELLSVVTHTNPYTYANKSLGILGWFATTNAQSAILTMIVPVVIMGAIRRKGKAWLPQLAVCALGFAMLFFFGTRLSFLAILATAVGLAFTILVAAREKKRVIAVLLVCAAVCVGCFPYSPMYQNQLRVAHNAVLKQENIDARVESDGAVARRHHLEGVHYERARLVGAYHFYLDGLVEKYGIARVAERYDYSTDAAVITNARLAKKNFCRMMMEDAPSLSRFFGLELGDMRYHGKNYDLENDFHGVYMLYGLAGIGLLALFLLYFLGLILWALVKDARRYYTLEAGAYGIALVMAMLHAYATAGLLRRPNASFYLSVILSVIYYLVKVRQSQGKTGQSAPETEAQP